MGFESTPNTSSGKNKEPNLYVGVKNNADGSMDYSQAAKMHLSDEQLEKIKKVNERKKNEKEQKEKDNGFEWENSIRKRHMALMFAKKTVGLSKHEEYELKKIEKVLLAIQEIDKQIKSE